MEGQFFFIYKVSVYKVYSLQFKAGWNIIRMSDPVELVHFAQAISPSLKMPISL